MCVLVARGAVKRKGQEEGGREGRREGGWCRG